MEQELSFICENLPSTIDAFLHDELAQSKATAVRQHLEECKRCQRVVATEVEFQNLVRQGRAEPMTRDMSHDQTFQPSHRGGSQPARIAVIAERRYLRQEMPGAVIQTFQARGIKTDTLCPRGGQFDPQTGIFQSEDARLFNLNDYDAVISRNRNGLGLTMLSYADMAGILTVNTPASISTVRNKAIMALRLARVGIPCPATILAENVSSFAALSSEWFPLILKATYGDNSQGLRVIRHPEDLAEIHWDDNPVLAQRYLANDGFDLKLYVCNQQVFAVRKPSPINGDAKAAPELISPTGCMIDLALRAGKIFGLEIYGVDTIETEDGIKVIEVNDFPNFSGVPRAAEYVADHILSRLAETRRLAS